MVRRLQLTIVAMLFAVPMVASADVIRVDYEARVYSTSGNGFGSSIGDIISGWFEFDTDDLYDRYGDGRYLYAGGPVESSRSASVDVYARQNDSVQIIDDTYRGYDSLYVRDGSYYSSYYSSTRYYAYHYLNLSHYSDWLDIDALLHGGSIDLGNIGNNLSPTVGIRDYRRRCGRYYYYSCYYSYNNGANATVTGGRISKVPEPGTLALLGIGLFGMGLARRQKKV